MSQHRGGIGVNTIPDHARALCDIRIPPGVTVDHVRAAPASAIEPLPDVSWRILECTEPNWTDPEEAIVRAVRENATAVTGRDVVVNLLAGFSDARFYRHAGVPSVVYGVGAHHMGGIDEYATVEDLKLSVRSARIRRVRLSSRPLRTGKTTRRSAWSGGSSGVVEKERGLGHHRAG